MNLMKVTESYKIHRCRYEKGEAVHHLLKVVIGLCKGILIFVPPTNRYALICTEKPG